MSAILKAMRKLEEEKRVAGHAAPDLRMDQGVAPAKPTTLVPLIAGIALGAVCVGLFFLWPSDPVPVVVTQKTPVPQSQIVTNRDIQPVSMMKPEVNKPDVDSFAHAPQGNLLKEQPSAKTVETEALVEVVLKAQPVASVDTFSGPDPKASGEISVRPLAQAVSAVDANKMPQAGLAAPETATTETVASPSLSLPKDVLLRVDEIFFQEESSNSMAVVNDLPVMVGTHVDSAVVLEIRPDTVVFKIGSKTYNVTTTSRQ